MSKRSPIVRKSKGKTHKQDEIDGVTQNLLEHAAIDLSDSNGKKKNESILELGHFEVTNDSIQTNSNIEIESHNETDENTIRIMHEIDDADEANEEEKCMTLMQALKRYPKAALWSILVSTTLLMEGYDTALLNSLFALPVFQKKFGSMNKEGSYEITSRWQIGLNMCVFIGEIIGLQMTGIAVESIGNRYTMIFALFSFSIFVFILYYGNSLAMIGLGQILCAMPWGCFQSLTVAYASEVCPLTLRYYLTTYSNMCWLMGQILAAGVMKNSEKNLSHSELGYRLPFALQWIFPAPLAVGIFFAPESPWWLVRKNKTEEAKVSLDRILSGRGPQKEVQVNLTLEQIKLTIEEERVNKTKGRSFYDCFRGIDGRRTRLTCLTWVAQNTSGAILLSYSTYFLIRAGLATNKAFTLTIIQYCLGLVGTICSWVISSRIGRWSILTAGLSFQMIILLVIGLLGFSSSSSASYGAGGLLLALSFFYNVGIGAVVYCIVAEMPSAELRTETIVLARNCYNLVAMFNTILTPYMLNVDNWNWGAKTGLYWAFMTAITLIWVIIDLPETSGRTFSEINELFAQNVPARKFKTTKVDPFNKRKIVCDIQEEEDAYARENQPLNRKDSSV